MANKIVGTKGDDVLVGTKGKDIIIGRGGDDVLIGKGGKDVLKGGSGDDFLKGGKGNDVLKGATGDDFLNGGKGNDVLKGATGDDFLKGGKGNDVLKGAEGNDFLFGGKGADDLWGGDGGDIFKFRNGDGTWAGFPNGSALNPGDGYHDVVYDYESSGSGLIDVDKIDLVDGYASLVASGNLTDPKAGDGAAFHYGSNDGNPTTSGYFFLVGVDRLDVDGFDFI